MWALNKARVGEESNVLSSASPAPSLKQPEITPSDRSPTAGGVRRLICSVLNELASGLLQKLSNYWESRHAQLIRPRVACSRLRHARHPPRTLLLAGQKDRQDHCPQEGQEERQEKKSGDPFNPESLPGTKGGALATKGVDGDRVRRRDELEPDPASSSPASLPAASAAERHLRR